MIIKTGTQITFEHGCYSDFSYHGPFKVIKDIDQSMVSEEFRLAKRGDYISAGDFVAWLSTSGYIDDVPGHVWYLGDYIFDPQIQEEK